MVDGRIDLDTGQPGFQFVERALNAARHVQCVEAGEFLDRHHQAGVFADDGVSDQRLMPLHEIGDVADARGRAAEWHLGKGTHGGDRQLVTDAEPLVRRFDEAAGAGRG